MPPMIDMMGKKFNKLLVIKQIKDNDGIRYICQCDCGNITKEIDGYKIRSGHTKSCGCILKEMSTDLANHMRKSIEHKFKDPIIGTAKKVFFRRYKEIGDTITFEDFYDMSQKDCYYCGSKPNNKQNCYINTKSTQLRKDNGNFIYNGLDRVDNTKPHTLENCVPCCKTCNYAKRERTVEEFENWIDKVYENLLRLKLI